MAFSIASSYSKIRALVDGASGDALPSHANITTASESVLSTLPESGLGEAATGSHLLQDLVPGFNGPKTSANYYGFVTGGVLPIAEVADNIVTAFDQNVQVHLPDQSVATLVEERALGMLLQLVNLKAEEWGGKIFTTGATGANILGLACGREFVIQNRLDAVGSKISVGENGILSACKAAGVEKIQVLTTMGHSSLYKAASVVGLGRASVIDIPVSQGDPWDMSLDLLEDGLKREGVASIVAISAGEVNTGEFAARGLSDMKRIRELCTKYGAWLHIDAAFGLFARSLPATPEFESLRELASGLELADSITGDGHKMLNVPYDCGFFFTRSATSLSSVFQNPNAAYLSSAPSSIPSPLNIGLENSRRFRALPVYAVLSAYGRSGFAEIFANQVRLARGISAFMQESEEFELLPRGRDVEDVHIIALFRARDEMVNKGLVKRVQDDKRVYVSGTMWEGRPACRIAVATWKVDLERDLELVTTVLKAVVQQT